MKCQHCLSELPDHPHEAVGNPDSGTSEVVAHSYTPEGFGERRTDYYCSYHCFVKEAGHA